MINQKKMVERNLKGGRQMSKGNNDAFVLNAEGKEFLYAVGNVTLDFPFLVETESGKLVTPFYLQEGELIGAVSGKSVYFPSYKKEEYQAPKVKAILRNLRVPTIALNISTEKYDRIAELSSLFSVIPKQKKPTGYTTVFVPMVAFSDDALRLHKEVSKGDTVILFGELKETLIRALGKTIMAVWVSDVRKERTARRNLKGAIVE
jgi:hypothetical protein